MFNWAMTIFLFGLGVATGDKVSAGVGEFVGASVSVGSSISVGEKLPVEPGIPVCEVAVPAGRLQETKKKIRKAALQIFNGLGSISPSSFIPKSDPYSIVSEKRSSSAILPCGGLNIKEKCKNIIQ
jgi:hypothetical protein